jgi:hypothetical protein
MANEGLILKLLKDVPKVQKPFPLICFIVNIIFPGCGTILAGILKSHVKSIIYGILQLFLSCVLIGWVWSVFWGFLIWKRGGLP